MNTQTRIHFQSGLLSCLLMTSMLASLQAGDTLKFGGPETSHSQLSFDEVDHSSFNMLLRHYVDGRGRVCYRHWAKNGCDINRLQTYLFYLTQVDPSRQATQEATMAYYINAYNALTLWGILDNYPVVSIQKIDGKNSRYSIFDDLLLWVGHRYLSLNEIENEALRPMGDNRIHFALVCAARGCPRLRNEAYYANFLDRQLSDNAVEFFSDRSRFHIAHLTGKVKISPILKWYQEDFGNNDYDVVSSVFPYLPAEHRHWLATHPGWTLSHLGYDWGLNDGCPTLPIALGKIPYRAYSRISPFISPLLPSNDRATTTSDSTTSDSTTQNADTTIRNQQPLFEPEFPPPLPDLDLSADAF
ncbi:MAG: DUF547 domain-containing protein [Fuerstiella sp.]